MYSRLSVREKQICEEMAILEARYKTCLDCGLKSMADGILDEIIELEQELKGIHWEQDARIY